MKNQRPMIGQAVLGLFGWQFSETGASVSEDMGACSGETRKLALLAHLDFHPAVERLLFHCAIRITEQCPLSFALCQHAVSR